MDPERTTSGDAGLEAERRDVERRVDGVLRPLMEKRGIPGMAVGLVARGRTYVFHRGVASLETRQPITGDTLFEIGSVSKTFTVTLASYARVLGKLALTDPVGKHLPALRNHPFGDLPLLHLATHTGGGMPLQVPDGIHDDAQLIRYFQKWRPAHVPGTMRTYANPSIGMLGRIAARSLGQDFTALVEHRLFPALAMRRACIDVPDARQADYAQGYTADGAPVRMAPGILSAEAYGVKTTAADLLRFVAANMGLVRLDPRVRRALTDTHVGYFRAGPMTQCLIWERYPFPVTEESLAQGNSPSMVFDAMPVTRIQPAQPPRGNVWINKTGSTNGFSAYVAFVPGQRLGIVLLANRSYPILERVATAFHILAPLAGHPRAPRNGARVR